MKVIVMKKWDIFKAILGSPTLDHGKAFSYIRELAEAMNNLSA